MLKSQASVATPMAEPYLFKLAKHFAKKIPVQQELGRAELQFEFGHCLMRAEGQVLHFECEAADARTEARLHAVLDAHLQLMTRREPLELHWQRG